jgi:hypothetical protein
MVVDGERRSCRGRDIADAGGHARIRHRACGEVDMDGSVMDSGVTDSSVAWTDAERDLMQRLRDHAFDVPGQRIDFTARLMREQGWSRAVATAAIEEYRRFCFLAIASGHAGAGRGRGVAPAPDRQSRLLGQVLSRRARHAAAPRA